MYYTFFKYNTFNFLLYNIVYICIIEDVPLRFDKLLMICSIRLKKKKNVLYVYAILQIFFNFKYENKKIKITILSYDFKTFSEKKSLKLWPSIFYDLFEFYFTITFYNKNTAHCTYLIIFIIWIIWKIMQISKDWRK